MTGNLIRIGESELWWDGDGKLKQSGLDHNSKSVFTDDDDSDDGDGDGDGDGDDGDGDDDDNGDIMFTRLFHISKWQHYRRLGRIRRWMHYFYSTKFGSSEKAATIARAN